MLKYILETTEKYRLEDLTDVDAFKKWLYEDGGKQGYDINSFGYTEKEIKSSGEYYGSYFIVTVKKIFERDIKEPTTSPLKEIVYNRSIVQNE